MPIDDFDEISPGETGADFKERVSPHELTGAKRQQWMKELWHAFNDVARKGAITLHDALSIAENLHVDGEEHYLEEHIANPKEVTFKQLADVLDAMSRASGNEYRDVELDRVVAEDGVHVEYLGPIDYVRYLCGGAEAVADSTDGRQTDLAVQYKLRLSATELSPKQLLIATTVSLLFIISAVSMIGMLLFWDYSIVEAVRRNVGAIHSGVAVMVDTMELKLLEFHALGIISTTELLARWNERLFDNAQRHRGLLNHHSATRLGLGLDAWATTRSHRENVRSRVRSAILADLAAAQVPVDAADASRFVNAYATVVNTPCPAATDVRSNLHNGSTACTAAPFNRTAPLPGTAVLDHVALRRGSTAFRVVRAWNGRVETLNGGACFTAPSTLASEDFCASFARTAAGLAANRSVTEGHAAATGIHNETAIVGVAGSVLSGRVTAVTTDQRHLIDAFRQRLVAIVNYLNFEFVRSTEIVISLRDLDSGVITAQATEFRFASGCFYQCSRFPPSAVNIEAAFRRRDSGWSLTPDYRPEPVIGGYSYVGSGLDLAIVFERDVIEVRGISFGVVRDVFETVNAALEGDLVLELVGFAGRPWMQNFPAYADCPPTTDCVVDPLGSRDESGYGTIYRYDCRHCQRIPETTVGGSELANYVCDDVAGCAASSATAGDVLRSKTAEPVLEEESRGDEGYFVSSAFATNYSVAVGLAVPKSRSTGKFRTTIAAVAGGAVALLIFGLFALVGSSMSSFSALEAEWSGYKEQLGVEKQKFGALVQGLIPPAVAERLMGGSRIIADHMTTASFVFVDVCGFSDLTRTWSSRHVARYMTYCVALMDSVAQHCDVLKLRSVGDLVVVVGLRDERHRTDHEFHPARRALQFASITMLLFSKLYEHRPQTSRVFREHFKDKGREGSSIEMPQLRIGVHCGPTISGAFTIGRASHFDFFGPGPALANRMQQTAMPNRIHVTIMVKEMLRNRDPANKYLFDSSRKTVVRGHGTITSFFVRTVTEHVPYELIRANGVDYARTRFDFEKGLRQHKTIVGDSESVVSSGSEDEDRRR